jgi:hypothetical protein
MKDIELKDCPFCQLGGNPYIPSANKPVRCGFCGAEGPLPDELESNVEAWNNRAISKGSRESEVERLVAELEETLEKLKCLRQVAFELNEDMRKIDMTKENIIEVCTIYRDKLSQEYRKRNSPNKRRCRLDHLLNRMIPLTIEFAQDGRTDKAFRWLGFMQGVLWAEGVYHIEELKKHNKPLTDNNVKLNDGIKKQFHKLWSSQVGTEGYDKDEWMRLQLLLEQEQDNV